MSLLVQAQTSDDDEEIMECLKLVLKSSSLGLVHESVDVNLIHSYTSESPLTPPRVIIGLITNCEFLGSWFACKFRNLKPQSPSDYS